MIKKIFRFFLVHEDFFSKPFFSGISTRVYFNIFFYIHSWEPIIIIIIKKDRQCKAGRGRLTPYQSEDPSPTLPTYRGKEEKGKIVEDKKRREQLGQQIGIGPALETRQSHTIKYGVNQIIPERMTVITDCDDHWLWWSLTVMITDCDDHWLW